MEKHPEEVRVRLVTGEVAGTIEFEDPSGQKVEAVELDNVVVDVVPEDGKEGPP